MSERFLLNNPYLASHVTVLVFIATLAFLVFFGGLAMAIFADDSKHAWAYLAGIIVSACLVFFTFNLGMVRDVNLPISMSYARIRAVKQGKSNKFYRVGSIKALHQYRETNKHVIVQNGGRHVLKLSRVINRTRITHVERWRGQESGYLVAISARQPYKRYLAVNKLKTHYSYAVITTYHYLPWHKLVIKHK